MGYHRRLDEPHRYCLISNRIHRGEFLFRPDQECNRILKGCLAREVERKNVRLVAYVFPSNDFHLVARFPDGNRAAFMRDFQGEVSRRITDYRGCDGEVFPKPYHPRTILDAEMLLDRISREKSVSCGSSDRQATLFLTTWFFNAGPWKENLSPELCRVPDLLHSSWKGRLSKADGRWNAPGTSFDLVLREVAQKRIPRGSGCTLFSLWM